MKLYLVGSLRNAEIPNIATALRARGYEVFDDWYAAGPEADDCWKKYEQERGHDYVAALEGHAARHVFEFDKKYLDACDAVVLVLPAGKSGHLEFGYCIGQGKPGVILVDSPDRWDVMYQFATNVVTNMEALGAALWRIQFPNRQNGWEPLQELIVETKNVYSRPGRFIGVDGSSSTPNPWPPPSPASGAPSEVVLAPQYLGTDANGNWWCSHCSPKPDPQPTEPSPRFDGLPASCPSLGPVSSLSKCLIVEE